MCRDKWDSFKIYAQYSMFYALSRSPLKYIHLIHVYTITAQTTLAVYNYIQLCTVMYSCLSVLLIVCWRQWYALPFTCAWLLHLHWWMCSMLSLSLPLSFFFFFSLSISISYRLFVALPLSLPLLLVWRFAEIGTRQTCETHGAPRKN